MSVQSEINRISGAVTEQASLIAQIQTALQNKAAGGGGSASVLQSKTVQPSAAGKTVKPDSGYDGLRQVVVSGDADLIPGNVKKGVTIFDVTGTLETGSASPALQTKTVTPTENSQDVTADSGYDGLSKVTVSGVSKTYVGSGVTRKAAATITPGTADQTIVANQYLSGKQTIKGDADLVPENIKAGVSIFNVLGTLATGGSGGSGPGISTNGYDWVIGDIKLSEPADTLVINHGLGKVPKLWFVFEAQGDIAPDDYERFTIVKGDAWSATYMTIDTGCSTHTPCICDVDVTSETLTVSAQLADYDAKFQSYRPYIWLVGG